LPTTEPEPSLNPSNQLIQVDQVRLEYPGPIFALEGVNLRIERGQFVSLLGPSGCGKSTILRLLAGLLRPSDGQVLVAGESPAVARNVSTPMSFVFQDPTLLPWRTVRDNVRLPLELNGAGNIDGDAAVAEAVARVGLSEFASRLPTQLSGGMRMRVSLARALVTKPRLLLFDEPFAALDDITRGQLNVELLNLWRAHGWTAVFVTHNISEAVLLSQRVLVMSARPGRILEDVNIDLPDERSAELRGTPEFARLVGKLGDILRRSGI
jgi:NitT/TauT family transport system ATP-binding protein